MTAPNKKDSKYPDKVGMVHFVPTEYNTFRIFVGDEFQNITASTEIEAIIYCQGFAAGAKYQYFRQPSAPGF